MRTLKLGLAILIGIYAGGVQAQQQQMTLKNCLEYALAHNQKLAMSKYDEENGKYKTTEVKAQALPQISANGTFTDNLQQQVLVFAGQTMKIGTKYNAAIAASLNQQLFNQSVFTGLKAAKTSEGYYRLGTQQTEEEVIYQTSQLFYQLQVSVEKLKVVGANITKLEQLVNATNAQYKNGLAKKIDVDRIRVNLTNQQTQQVQLQNSIKQVGNQLKYSMGMPINTGVEIPLVAVDADNKEALNAYGAQLDVSNRTEFKLLKKQEELLVLQRKAYLADYYPSLSLGANYSYNGMGDKINVFNNDDSNKWFGMASVGLTLKIPIFDGFARRSRVSQANVSLKKLNEQLNQTTMGLEMAHENARVQIQNSMSTIQSQKVNVRLAEEVYASSQNNYKLGLATLSDLLDAETSLVVAQNSYTEALLQYKLADLDMVKSKGQLRSLLN